MGRQPNGPRARCHRGGGVRSQTRLQAIVHRIRRAIRSMKIRLKMFAILKDRSGVSEIELELPEAATVADAVSLIRQRFEAIAELLPQVAAAVNLSYAERSHVL